MTWSIGIINRIERYIERIFSVPQLVTFPIGNCIKENSKLIMFKTKALAQQPTESTSLLKEGARGGYSSNKKIAIVSEISYDYNFGATLILSSEGSIFKVPVSHIEFEVIQ